MAVDEIPSLSEEEIKSGPFGEKTEYWTPIGAPKSPLTKKEGDGWVGCGLWGRSKKYLDGADPIVDFVLSELERIRKDGKPLPIVLCARPGCGKIVVSERVGRRKYCDGCKDAANNAKKSNEVKNLERWLYRLLEKNPGVLKKVFTDPEKRQRLQKIKDQIKDQKNPKFPDQIVRKFRQQIAQIEKTIS